MRVLLIDPPGPNTGLAVGLGYLSAALKQRGHEIQVLDLNNRDLNRPMGGPNEVPDWNWIESEVAETLNEFDPEVAGLSVKTCTARAAARIGRLCKSHKAIPLVVGGAHATLDGPTFILEEDIEFAISGEGEQAFLELLEAIERGADPGSCPGVIVKGTLGNPQEMRAPFIEALDEIPFPDYRDFSSVRRNGMHIPDYSLITSRGCPYSCTFCSIPKIAGKRMRYRSALNVVEELRLARETYGIQRFHLVDDNFTLNQKRAIEVCEQIVEHGLVMPWRTQNGIRADKSILAVLEKMAAAGCIHVWLGVEAVDSELFESIRKGESLEAIEATIRAGKQAGIKVGGFFIVGLPGATYEKDLKIVEWVRRQDIQGWFFLFSPYPHTESWDWVQENGHFLKSFLEGQQYGQSIDPVFETDDYPAAQRIKAFYRINFGVGSYENLIDNYQSALANIRTILLSSLRHHPATFPRTFLYLFRKYGAWWIERWRHRFSRILRRSRAAAL